MDRQSKIFVAGHQGLAGSAILRKLKESGFHNLVMRTVDELDLRDQMAVKSFFEQEYPEYVFLAAESHGGIEANNTMRAEFIYDNLMIQSNVINESYLSKVRKLVNVSSSVVYDGKNNEAAVEEIVTVPSTDSPYHFYAVAKLAGIKLCQAYYRQYGCEFISVIHSELYHEYENHNSVLSPVLPSLMQKLFDAKWKSESAVEIWGTGASRKEFLYADDLADACLFIMNADLTDEIVNIGPGDVISIKELAEVLKSYMKFNGELKFNPAKPDDQHRVVLDCKKIGRLGWTPTHELRSTLKDVVGLFEHMQNSMQRRQPSTRLTDV